MTSLTKAQRARLVALAIEHLAAASRLLRDADSMCADGVRLTLDNVKWNYKSFWAIYQGAEEEDSDAV